MTDALDDALCTVQDAALDHSYVTETGTPDLAVVCALESVRQSPAADEADASPDATALSVLLATTCSLAAWQAADD